MIACWLLETEAVTAASDSSFAKTTEYDVFNGREAARRHGDDGSVSLS